MICSTTVPLPYVSEKIIGELASRGAPVDASKEEAESPDVKWYHMYMLVGEEELKKVTEGTERQQIKFSNAAKRFATYIKIYCDALPCRISKEHIETRFFFVPDMDLKMWKVSFKLCPYPKGVPVPVVV